MARVLSVIVALAVATNVASGARLNLEKMRQEQLVASKLQTLEQYRAMHAHVVAVDVEFLDFGKIVDWAKNEAKDIMQTIKDETMETYQEVKDIVSNRAGNFKQVLAETREKCAGVLRNLKGELAEGMKKIGEQAKDELPKFLVHLEGLKAKLGQARDALTAQLMAGSMSGAGDVVQEHLSILWEEAKSTASGPMKEQLLASADLLKGELGKLLDDVKASGNKQFTAAFSDTMEDTEDLVHQLIGEVQDQIKESGEELAGKVGKDLQEAGEDLVDGVKNGDFKPEEAAAPAALLQMTRGKVTWAFLKEQMEKLRAAAKDLADAAVQAASAQAEKIIDAVTKVSNKAGEAVMKAVDEHLLPKLEEWKAKGLVFMREKLGLVRSTLFQAADDAVAKLTELNAFAGEQAKALLDKHGPAAEEWAKGLEDRIVDMADANTNIDKARDAFEAALDEKLAEAAAALQEQLREAKGEMEVQLRQKLAEIETELFEKRTFAYKAQKEAAKAIEALAAKATDAVGALKNRMQQASGDDLAAMQEQLTALQDFAKKLQALAKDYGAKAEEALSQAQA